MGLIKYIDAKEFRESGLLAELNRKFLHPLGLALETRSDEGQPEVIGGIWDFRHCKEGLIFKMTDELKESCLKAQEFIKEKYDTRKEELGYVYQDVGEEKILDEINKIVDDTILPIENVHIKCIIEEMSCKIINLLEESYLI